MATRSQCWHFLISASRRCCRSWTSCYKLHILSAHSIYGYYMEVWLARKIVAATNQHLGGPHCRDAFGNDRQVSRTVLTHWGWVTHICVSEIIIIGSDNGLSPGRRQAIIWTNARILLIGPLGNNFNEISLEINTFSFKKMHLQMSSAKWRLFRLGLNVSNCQFAATTATDRPTHGN